MRKPKRPREAKEREGDGETEMKREKRVQTRGSPQGRQICPAPARARALAFSYVCMSTTERIGALHVILEDDNEGFNRGLAVVNGGTACKMGNLPRNHRPT